MPISVTEVVDAPIGDVWAIVSDFGGLARWHPAVQHCEMTGSGVGARRFVRFEGWTVDERLDGLDIEKHQIDYRVLESSRPQVVGVWGSVRLTPLDAGRTQIEWRAGVAPDRNDVREIEEMLANAYPRRVEHLREALGVSRAH